MSDSPHDSQAVTRPTSAASPSSRSRCRGAGFPAALALLVLIVASGPLAGQMPEGWEMRMDRADSDASEISFTTMGPGLHVTTGPAAIFWDPDNTATGAFRAEVELTQMEPTAHPEAYGLFIGGENLDADNQSYLYFLVRQDGSYLITHRAGAETHTIQGWTQHEAVQGLEGEGRVTNALAIEVDDREVSFHVNGTRVESYPADQMETDGVVGLRVNHGLDVHIQDFGIRSP